MIVDLHTHTVFSDGVLIPAESVRRAKTEGYAGIAITDHADNSNITHIISSIIKFRDVYNREDSDFKVLCGVELTHVRPSQIGVLVKLARELGADIVLVHGETIMEPVEAGTNRAAIAAKVDILAHPGMISEPDVIFAKEQGVLLEITSRRGHSYTNGHVANLSLKHGVPLVINNDFHAPGDYIGYSKAIKILTGANLNEEQAKTAIENGIDIFKRRFAKIAT